MSLDQLLTEAQENHYSINDIEITNLCLQTSTATSINEIYALKNDIILFSIWHYI